VEGNAAGGVGGGGARGIITNFFRITAVLCNASSMAVDKPRPAREAMRLSEPFGYPCIIAALLMYSCGVYTVGAGEYTALLFLVPVVYYCGIRSVHKRRDGANTPLPMLLFFNGLGAVIMFYSFLGFMGALFAAVRYSK
jgi:hypothetical protein